ncbi:YjcZ family sporulation protein [Evansella sp. LMS18]|nr:YjcZ family sporulation protein [Evansella sp. LMS18]UTR09724.1 YjcZ family sporulation protein [Evansella sp. LMS18]
MSYYHYGYCKPGYSYGSGFALVLVLFILLVIIGAAVVRF